MSQPPSIAQLEQENDPVIKALLLAALVSKGFREKGYEAVVVGGSAIEFYTDGAYMSGDIDICWAGATKPTPVERAAVMAGQLGAKGSGGTRTWKVAGLFVDLLGELETKSGDKLTRLETPAGDIVMPPVEELLVERVFSARLWAAPNQTDEECAAVLMTAFLSEELKASWDEVERIASLPDYDCLQQVREMRDETLKKLEGDV